MSLLWMEYEDEFQNLAETSFACEKAAKPEYFSRLDKRAHKIVYRDTRYNIDFLYTAASFYKRAAERTRGFWRVLWQIHFLCLCHRNTGFTKFCRKKYQSFSGIIRCRFSCMKKSVCIRWWSRPISCTRWAAIMLRDFTTAGPGLMRNFWTRSKMKNWTG